MRRSMISWGMRCWLVFIAGIVILHIRVEDWATLSMPIVQIGGRRESRVRSSMARNKYARRDFDVGSN